MMFIFSLLILLLFPVNGQITNGNDFTVKEEHFNYCQTREISRIVDTNPDCKNPYNKTKNLLDQNLFLPILEIFQNESLSSSIYILSKNQYFLNTIGYQCYKSIRTTWLNETWYFSKSKSQETEIIHVKSLDCHSMIQSQMCGTNRMQCNNDGCWYKSPPTEEYFYGSDRKIEDLDCSFNKKQILAETENSSLYFSPLNNCKPSDLSCELHDSIVVWEKPLDNACSYSIIHKGLNYTINPKNIDIIQSEKDKFAFQITGEIQICNGSHNSTIRAYTTTSDLLIVFEADIKAKGVEKLPRSENAKIYNKQHDINNLILAELDSEKAETYDNLLENIEKDVFQQCKQLTNTLKIVSKYENKLSSINDIMGREVIIFSLKGVVYLPFCIKITNIKIENISNNKCFKDLPISFEIHIDDSKKSNITSKQGFLTDNNFIRDDSYEIDCDLIDYHQILPSKKYMLIRKAKNVMVFPIGHMIVHDLTSYLHRSHELNFNHHKEIIQNYQPNTITYEFESNHYNDINGGFYSMPNDHHLNKDEYYSDTKQNVYDLISFKRKIDNWILIIWIIIGILSSIVILSILIKCGLTFTGFFYSLKIEKEHERNSKEINLTVPLTALSMV